jgi:hypothetical protein
MRGEDLLKWLGMGRNLINSGSDVVAGFVCRGSFHRSCLEVLTLGRRCSSAGWINIPASE